MDVNQITKITLASELLEQGVPKIHIAEKVGIGRATLYRWLQGIEKVVRKVTPPRCNNL